MQCNSLLQQRIASGAQASCSVRTVGLPPASSLAAPSLAPSSRRPTLIRAKKAPRSKSPGPGPARTPQYVRRADSPYDNIRYVNNVAPDFEDPEWADKVTDWNEFWHNAEWDDDIMELEDEHDVPKEIVSDMRLQRAEQLIAALGNLDARDNVVRFLGPVEQHSYTREDPNEFELPNEKDDPNPDWTPFDFRAMVEKRRKREMLDQEWQRRQALVGRFNGLSLEGDVRLQGETLVEDWSHEDFMKLITGDGAYVHPDKVKVSVENPLAVSDYSWQYGVYAIPETEEAIAAMGHLADESVLVNFEQGVALGAADFVDPTLAFGDPDTGVMTLQAPHNRWAHLQHARRGEDAADLLEALGGRPGSFRHPQDDIPPDLVWPDSDEEDGAEE